MNIKTNTCCFIGHRTIDETEELKSKLKEIIEKLIIDEKVDTFLFGSKSRFNSLCREIVTEIKEKYPHIKRIYVRAEFPYISDDYKNYLLEYYDDTYYPEHIIGAGKAAYVERNFEMINNSSFCIIYYDEQKAPTTRKSGTEIALNYAMEQGKQIINLL
ncbi:MAG: SLOG family protein [Acutalibacteraceae bacterium]